MTGRFSGRSALVTGGGSGIGAALTRALTAAGADVLCTDIDLAAATSVAGSVHGPGRATAMQLDVTDASAVQMAVDSVVGRTGSIDLLFNNAGIVFGGPTEDLTLDHWDRIIDINLRGVVNGVHAAYPHMIKAGGGHIVNTASAAGLMASGFLTSYCATKFAVVGLSLALRAEATTHGIGVTVICPSAVETPLLDTGSIGGFRGRNFFMEAERIKRAYSPEKLAAGMLRAVERDDPWLVAPARTRLGWAAMRFAPRLMQGQVKGFVARQRAQMG